MIAVTKPPAICNNPIFTFQRYGKGLDPKARLNYCDCAVYALAKSLDAPLLFKGDDFIHTDIQPALRA